VNEDIVKGKWARFKGEIQSQWGKFTDDDLDVIKGDSKKIVGLLQERYGYAKEEAHKHFENFQKARKD